MFDCSVLLIIFHLRLLLCTKSSTESWMHFRQDQNEVKPVNFKSFDFLLNSVEMSNILKKYNRGFPRGVWGTVIFPDIYKGSSDNDAGYSFWSKYDSIIFDQNSRLKDSFNNFRNKLYLDSCMEDNSKTWRCCEHPNYPGCSTLPSNAKAIETMLRDPQIDVGLTFAYLWCTKAWANFHNFNDIQQKNILEDIEIGCPNPCFGNPCKSTRGVKNHICHVTGTFENDYECNCKEDMIWDRSLKTCLPTNPCDRKRFPVCIPENILQCIAYNSSAYECICKPDYMGIDCSLPRDACHERVNKSQSNGDYNCQIHLGNICQPILGTDYYDCICLGNYQPLLHTTEPNCFGRVNPCHTIQITDFLMNSRFHVESSKTFAIVSKEHQNIYSNSVIYWGLTCLNGGQCVASDDFTQAACVCHMALDNSVLYTGLNCEYSTRISSSWTPPPPSFAEDCSLFHFQYRKQCLKNNIIENQISNSFNSSVESNDMVTVQGVIQGASEEISPYSSLEPCFKQSFLGFTMEETFSYKTLHHLLYITIFIVILSGVIWHVFRLSIV
ncbi:unnamed protein product [Schistosoma turkestanicum]|nr:unnamed protein product [Schistosoma turkestanicum]